MTCERYWRDGVVLYERGVSDLHRESCTACQDAHAVLMAMADALPLVGEDIVTDPLWKSKVLEAIDSEAAAQPAALDRPASRPAIQIEPIPEPAKSIFDRVRSWGRSGWFGGAFVGAAAILMLWLAAGRRTDDAHELVADKGDVKSEVKKDAPHFGITMSAGAVTRRSASQDDKALPTNAKRYANQGDTFTITARPEQEIRVYRDDRVILRCPTPNAACTSDDASNAAKAVLDTPGNYAIVLTAPPKGHAMPAMPGNFDGDMSKVVEIGGTYEVTEIEVR